MSLTRIPIPSPNYSSRGGTGVRLIVIHTAEGALTYQSLGSFFANPASGVSSHVGIDDTPNTVGEYVRRDYKAWTQGNANPYSVAAELCAFAAWSAGDWAAHPAMLSNCAAWIAEEAAAFGIPLVALTAAQAQGGAAGVCQHADLGAAGGGHWDCGHSFPMAQVIDMARGGAVPAPQPPEVPEMTDDQLRAFVALCYCAFLRRWPPDDERDWYVAQIKADPANGLFAFMLGFVQHADAEPWTIGPLANHWAPVHAGDNGDTVAVAAVDGGDVEPIPPPPAGR